MADIVLPSIVSLVMVESGAIDPPFSFDILLGFVYHCDDHHLDGC